MSPDYETEVRRATSFARAATGPVAEYYRGYRHGVTASESSVVADESAHAALLRVAETSPRDIRTRATKTSAARAARAWGYVDGLHWRDVGVRPGLVRLAIVQSGLTSAGFADTLTRDERTIRNWQNSGQRIPAAALQAIERRLIVGAD